MRLKRNKNIRIVLATSNNEENKKLVNLARKCKIEYFVDTIGSEDDVLGRFIRAGEFFKAQTIIRVCADNPLIDPAFIDDLVKKFKYKTIDYMCNHIPTKIVNLLMVLCRNCEFKNIKENIPNYKK